MDIEIDKGKISRYRQADAKRERMYVAHTHFLSQY
jgi:hypothetical protein